MRIVLSRNHCVGKARLGVYVCLRVRVCVIDYMYESLSMHRLVMVMRVLLQDSTLS